MAENTYLRQLIVFSDEWALLWQTLSVPHRKKKQTWKKSKTGGSVFLKQLICQGIDDPFTGKHKLISAKTFDFYGGVAWQEGVSILCHDNNSKI